MQTDAISVWFYVYTTHTFCMDFKIPINRQQLLIKRATIYLFVLFVVVFLSFTIYYFWCTVGYSRKKIKNSIKTTTSHFRQKSLKSYTISYLNLTQRAYSLCLPVMFIYGLFYQLFGSKHQYTKKIKVLFPVYQYNFQKSTLPKNQ